MELNANHARNVLEMVNAKAMEQEKEMENVLVITDIQEIVANHVILAIMKHSGMKLNYFAQYVMLLVLMVVVQDQDQRIVKVVEQVKFLNHMLESCYKSKLIL